MIKTATEKSLMTKKKTHTIHGAVASFYAAAAFCFLLALLLSATPSPGATLDDLYSGRYAEDQPIVSMPLDSVITCSGEGGYGRCISRSVAPEPTECGAGQVLITMRKYGSVSRQCVPE